MRLTFRTIFVLGFLLASGEVFANPETPDARSGPKTPALKPDVVLVAIPVRARSIMVGGTVNALEKPVLEMPAAWTAVVFQVERVLEGDFKIPPREQISLWSQMKDAADAKNILKILSMDFEKPEEGGTNKEWLSMAVIDSYASFGIREDEAPDSRRRYKLFLAKTHRDPDSFVLVKSEKLGS